MKVSELKWYHRVYNVCVSPIVISIISVVTVVCPFVYIISGEDGLCNIYDWVTGLLWIED